jgi:hypothetical protein
VSWGKTKTFSQQESPGITKGIFSAGKQEFLHFFQITSRTLTSH